MEYEGQSVEDTEASMGVPHITSFCCCLGLQAGATFVGVVHLIASIIMMIICSIFAENARQYIGTVEDAGDHVYSTWYKIAIGIAVLSVGHIILAATLLLSVYKRSTAGLRAWAALMSVLLAAALLFVLVSAALHGVSGSGSEIFLSFLEGVIFFGFVGYCILCVYSYYLMLKSTQDMEGPKTDY